MEIRTKKIIDVSEWDKLVTETYKRPYSFQQQDGCKSCGLFCFSVPSDETDDFENESVPEVIDTEEMGVSFSSWLKRNPNTPIDDIGNIYISLWWKRNFYPEFQMVANDLHAKGLLEAGDYTINIDW